jgi:quercetin dioxygenase-like cupin family protein
MLSKYTVSVGAALLLAGTAAAAQQGISRANLSKHDLQNDPGHEAIQVRVSLAPGASAPRHSHPGEEIVYVIKGAIEYRLEGQPPVRLTKGQSLFIPDGALHSVRNVGGTQAIELATYIVSKGEPLLEPAK